MDAVTAVTQEAPFCARLRDWRRQAATGAALLGVLAGILHLYIAPQHFSHLGHGLFLGLAGVTQVAWGVAFWRRPSPALFRLGLVLAGTLMALWAITRVLPAPFGHGGPGRVEPFGVSSKVAEVLTLAVLLAMALARERLQESRGAIRQMLLTLLLAGSSGFILYSGGLAAERMVPWLGLEDEDNLAERFDLSIPPPSASPLESSVSLASEAALSAPSAAEPGSSAASAMGALTPAGAARALPALSELLRVLVRDGVGPLGIHVQMVYAPPLLFQVSGQKPPASSLQTPAVIFTMLEDGHQNCDRIPDQPAEVLLRLDQGEPIRPSEVTVLRYDGDMERTSRLLFPLPPGLNLETLAEETHTLTIIVPLESTRATVFTWQLPLPLATQPSLKEG